MVLQEMIAALSGAMAPSGSEGRAREIAGKLVADYVDETKTDTMGNLIALRRCADAQAPTVLLDAHLDEIGLIVTGYEQGFLRFHTLGGVDPRMLPALEVRLLAQEPLYGVIDVLPPHVLTEEEREKPLDAEKLYIDAGLTEEEARRLVPPGTPAVFASGCAPLGKHRLCGKSLDDRSCAAILIRAMELVKDEKLTCHVALLFAAQEEVGCRGAVTGAYALAPEAAVAVDVTFGASPDAPAEKTFPLNAGPTVGVGPNMNRSVSDRLLALAAEKGIPVQTEVMAGCSGTDAWVIQTSREGVATGVLSLPLKYMHTPVEVLDLRDAEAAAQLLAAWLLSYGKEAGEHA